MSSRYDAVVFDFGGVYTASPFDAVAGAAADLGIPHERILELIFGSYDEDTDHPWHKAERGEIGLEACRDEIRTHAAAAEGIDLDLYEVLRHLATGGGVREVVIEATLGIRGRGLKTALLTNNVAEFAELWRPLLPLDQMFDAVVDSSEVGMRKPDAAIFLHTLELLGGVAPERAVFLDDFAGNVAAAERVGMTGILVEPDPTSALARLDQLLT